jgi:hypothetical protein
MFSLPLNTTLSTDYIRSQCGSQNKIWNYNSVSQLYEEAIQILPGKGYWFKVDSACTVSVTGSNVQSIPDLKAGWNQIGAFSQSFNFNDIKGNCNILSGPWKYNPVSLLYESSTTLDPSYGYWIKVSSDCKLMKNCPDGTINGICSATKPKYCDYGNLVDRCNICNCPTGYQCKSDYSCVLMQTCSDGTIGGQCSSNKPLYCDNGNLVNKCSQCGCPINYECQSDGSCVPSPPTTPTCDSTCKAQGFSSGTCKTGGSQGLLPSPVQFNLISNPRDGTGGKTFHTHNTLITMFKTLFDKYPGYASYESIGKTYEGRDIALFKIGNPNGGKVLWDGSLHGWEDAGGEVEYLISKWLLENGTTGIDQTAKRIIERNLILFVPVINMDSYERQNRNFATCNYGTDLNRNFEIGWSSNPCADYPNCYHGSFNVSEKETQAMRSIFQNYKPNFYLNTHYGGGQYVQSASSTSIESNLIQRIKQISGERGVTPYSMSTGNGGGNGMAYGDAKNLGQSSAWFIEINNDNLYANGASRPTTCSCYSHTCDTYQDVVNVIYPRMLPILIGMAESSEVIPTTTTSTCQTGETNIGQDGCSSGICCCSGTITPSQFQININPNSVIGKNNFSIGFMTDWSWLGFISDDARRQLVKDANFKLVRVFDFRTTSPKIMPCYSWDSVKNNCTSWDWTQLDLFTQKVFEIGAEPIFTLGWASQNTQNYIPSGMPINSTSGLPNTGSYAVYASEWVKHFKQKGWPVRYYEIMNEPFAYFGWNPSPSNNLKLTYFVDIWNVVARAMRQQNPNILLSQDALTQTNVLNYWLQYGDNVDYLDFHKYDCGTWNKSDPAYYSDEKLFGLAETSRFESTSSTYGVKESQQKWLTSRGKLLPVINSESNLNSAWEGGTDPRIQQMTGAVWKALELRQGIIKGVSYSVYYEFSSNANDGQSRPAKGYGFGMINSVNNTPWYPYYVQKWIGKNLYVGDNLVQSTSSSNNIRALSWINNGKLNLFIIHNSTKSETVSLQGVTGQFNYWKIDDPYGTSYLNPIEQTGAINAGSAITLNGYTVILLQQTITSQTCSDGTAYNQCSATKPKYCSSGTLINSCSVCGCPSGQSCNTTTNACYIPVTCTCGNWTNGACGGSCSSGYRQQTRTCTPTGCTPADGLGTSRCVADASCSAQTGIEVKGIQWFYNSGPNTYSSSAATQALNDLNTTIPHFNYVYLDVWVNASRTDNITVVRDGKDSQYISAIQKARSIGKKVIIRIRHRPSPYDFQPANTDLWLKNFTKAVVDWATFSQQYGVEMFSIVNEFNKWDSDAYSSYWNSLISQVRKVYSGSVIANINNWDKSQSQFEQKRTATWLKSLDYIAVSAYWDLCSSGGGTTVDQLVNSWQPYVAGLKNISDTHGKKIIIITGLSSASNVTVPTCSAPWDGDPTHWQQPDLTAQDNWYEAVFRVFNDKPWIYGYLFDTAWFTYQISNPTTNKEGTVQGKPAAKTIEKWFGGTLTNTCSDGTAYSSCSITKPKYCSSGTLIDKCSQCGCLSGTCQADGSCKSIVPTGTIWGANLYVPKFSDSNPSGYAATYLSNTVFQAAKDMGITHIILWQYNFNEKAQTITQAQMVDAVTRMKNYGLQPIIVLDYDTAKAAALVQALGSNCMMYEVCKEPHVLGSSCYADEATYANNWNAVVSACRAVNPNAMYGGPAVGAIPGTSPRSETWMREWLNKCDGDFVSVHAFYDPIDSKSNIVSRARTETIADVAYLKDILADYGKQNLPIVYSEVQWTAVVTTNGWDMDQTFNDDFSNSLMSTMEEQDVYAVMYWALIGYNNNFAIIRPPSQSYEKKPQYYSIQDYINGIVKKCSDGTIYDQCSLTKPKYCSSGTLIDKCSTCGCEPNLDCNTTSQSCYSAINRNYIINYLNESFYRYLGSDVFSLTWVVDSYDILGVSPPDRNSVIKFFDSKQNQTDGTWLSRTNHYVPITAQVLMLYNRSGVKPAKSLDTFFSRIDTWDKVKAEVQTYDSGNYWGGIWGYVQVYVVYKNQAPPWINEFLNEINTNFDSWANYSHQRTHVVMNLYALNLPIPRVDDVVTRTLQQQKVDGSWEYHEPETNFNIGMLGFLRSQTAVDQKLIDSAIAKGVEYIKKCYRTVDCQGKICGAFSKNSTSVDLSVWYTAQGVFATLNPQSDIWSRWVIPKQTSYPTYYSPAIPSNVWAEWRNRTTKENLWKNLWNAHGLGSKIRVAGKSVQSRDVYLFEAGNPNAPALFVDVEIHGNEDHPEEILLMFAYWLLNGEDTGNATAQRIMQKNRILFMPILDTDMSDKSSTGTFKRNNANAVNLNRNFEYNWASSTDPEKGPSAASEPETQTVKSVFTTYKPRVYMNLHTGAFMAHAYGNSSLSNAIIADAPSFSSYFHASYSGTHGGLGFAVSDAVDDSPGVSSWLIEFFRQSITDPEYNAWMHDSTNLNMNEDRYYPKFQEFLISALSNIEAS